MSTKQFVILPPDEEQDSFVAYGPIAEDALEAAIQAEAVRRYGPPIGSRWTAARTNLLGDGYRIAELVPGPNAAQALGAARPEVWYTAVTCPLPGCLLTATHRHPELVQP